MDDTDRDRGRDTDRARRDTDRSDRDINWLLWGGLALLIALAVLSLPLLGDDGDTTAPGGEDELADEEQPPADDEPTTTGNETNTTDNTTMPQNTPPQ